MQKVKIFLDYFLIFELYPNPYLLPNILDTLGDHSVEILFTFLFHFLSENVRRCRASQFTLQT